MVKRKFDLMILELMEKHEDEYTIYEVFQGCLGMGINVFMKGMDDGSKDPLEVMNGIMEDALKLYIANNDKNEGG